MASSNNNGGTVMPAIMFAVAVVAGGIILTVIAFINGVVAFRTPHPILMIAVPFLMLFVAAYAAAFLLDHQPDRRLLIAVAAAVAGSIVFFIVLRRITNDAPELWHPGALQAALVYFGVFAILPTVGVCLLLACLHDDLRAALTGETLVDLSKLPPELLAPIEPYLEDYLRQPAWRRFSLVRWFMPDLASRNRYRITEGELQELFARSSELAAAREQSYRSEKAAIDAQIDLALRRDVFQFLQTLTPEEQSLLALRLRASAAVEARVPRGMVRTQ